MQPVIQSLNEPAFTVEGIYLYASTSIEGNDTRNDFLRRERAKTLLNVLEVITDKKIENSNIILQDSWKQFKLSVENTKYEYLKNLTEEEVKNRLKDEKLLKEMEPILAKQRYARIVIDISYTVSGENEEVFIVDRFNKAIIQNDIELAIKIQKLIMLKIIDGRYSISILDKLQIPFKYEYVDLLMNNIYIKKRITSEALGETHLELIDKLYKKNSNDDIVLYNKLVCEVKLGYFVGEAQVNQFQKELDRLYMNRKIGYTLLDNLKLEFYFKVIGQFSSDNQRSNVVKRSFEEIISMISVKDATWQRSLMLANYFFNHKNYALAAKAIESYTKDNEVDEDLLYTYIMICSHLEEKLKSETFVNAMNRAKNMNKDRYCNLFTPDKLSFQLFDNPLVKRDYCLNCIK